MAAEATNDDEAWMVIGRCQLDTRITNKYPACQDGSGNPVDIDVLLPRL
jgi:hypothetical protein